MAGKSEKLIWVRFAKFYCYFSVTINVLKLSFGNILDVFVCNKFKFKTSNKVEDHANFGIKEYFLRLTNGLNR